ncbi:MAG: TonB-dependent receptor [Paludibacteraceae bacterium]|nr:TonB-dependent receptor [Paludibacteraceae bacterium]
MERKTTYIIGLLTLCLTLSVSAQNVYPHPSRLDSMQYLDEVSVTAIRATEVIPTQRISGEDLKQLNSFSVADAVRYFSGVQVKDYGGVGGLKTVDIRSMGTNHLGVFYDGIEVGNAQNGTVDLGKFSLENLEEISLYNGQKSDIFQPAKDFGSSGSLYLKTRRPTFQNGKKQNISVGFKTGSFGLLNPSILYERQLAPRIHLSANAEYTYATGRYRFRYRRVNADGSIAYDTTAVRHNGDLHALRAEAGIFGYTDQGKWHAKAYYYDSERGIPGAIVNNVWTNAQRQWDRNLFVQSGWQQHLAEHYDLQVNAKFSRDYMRYLNPDTTLKYIDNNFTQQEVYLSTANRYAIRPFWHIALSADWQINWLQSNMVNFVNPRRNTLLVAAATSFDRKHLKAQASLLGTYVNDHIQRTKGAAQAAESTLRFTPAVFASVQPWLNRRMYIRAFYKRIFRMPTFNDLYYTDIGNIALNPEYTTQYNFGISYDHVQQDGVLAHAGIKADAYYIEVDDKIVAIPKGNGQYRWQMMNIGYVEIRGIDANAHLELRPMTDMLLKFNLTYTYQKAQDFSDAGDPVTYGGQIAYIPWHSGSAVANITWRTWSLNYSFIYVGERYHNSANIQSNHEQPWYTHDLTLRKILRGKHLTTDLALEVNNLLDQQYDVILNYPMPGRNYKLIVKLSL